MGMESAPGVVKEAPKLYVTCKDVEVMLGCAKSKAYNIVRDTNAYAKSKGMRPFVGGKANKYIFADLYGIPIEDVEKVISNG